VIWSMPIIGRCCINCLRHACTHLNWPASGILNLTLDQSSQKAVAMVSRPRIVWPQKLDTLDNSYFKTYWKILDFFQSTTQTQAKHVRQAAVHPEHCCTSHLLNMEVREHNATSLQPALHSVSSTNCRFASTPAYRWNISVMNFDV